MNCCSTGNVLQSTNPRHKVQALCWQVYQNRCRCNKREAFIMELKLESTSLPKLIRYGLIGCIDLGQKEVGDLLLF